MSRALLDTSGYSAFMRSDPILTEMLQTVDAIYMNAVVLGELRAGFLRGRMRQKNEARWRQFLASSRVSALSIDEDTDSDERYLDCGVRDAARFGGDHDGRAFSENPTNSGLA